MANIVDEFLRWFNSLLGKPNIPKRGVGVEKTAGAPQQPKAKVTEEQPEAVEEDSVKKDWLTFLGFVKKVKTSLVSKISPGVSKGVEKAKALPVKKALPDKGIVKKFKAVIDWKKAGDRRVYGIIQVKLTPQERAGFARAAKEISKDARVNGVYVATGEYDLMVFLQGGSIDDISDFVTEKLAPRKEVIGTNTHIILSIFKKDGVEFFDEDTKRLLVSP